MPIGFSVQKGSDEELVRLAAAGNRGAFEQLVERYQDRIYNMLARMSGSADEAEDLAQETFMRSWRALGGFKQGARFYTWLYRIALNTVFSVHRSAVRRKNHEGGRLDAESNDGRSRMETVSARPEYEPAQRLDTRWRQERVNEGLQQIDPDYRSILILRDMEGLDYDAIAEALSITRPAVKSRLHRARREMARILKDLKPEHGKV